MPPDYLQSAAFRLSSENMADSKSYGTRGVVLDHRDLPHLRPMLTMTGISYLP
jgi:hypothetical protein